MKNERSFLKKQVKELNKNLAETIDQLLDSLDEKERALNLKIEELEHANQRHLLIQKGVGFGIWDWVNIEEDKAYLNDRLYEQLGYERGDSPPKFSSIVSLTHPDDRDYLAKKVKEHLEHDMPYQVEYRARTKSGEYRWLRSSGKCLRDEAGKPIRMAGSTLDIHEQRIAEKEIHELNHELSAANEEMLAQNEELSILNEKANYTNQRLEELVEKRTRELEEKNSKLLTTVKELEARNFELDNIVYKISHDIRSPIATMLGVLQLAEMQDDKAEMITYLKLAKTQTQRLDHFVYAMLNFAKASRTKAHAKTIDLKKLIDHSFESLQYHPNFQRVNCQVAIEYENACSFRSDSIRLDGNFEQFNFQCHKVFRSTEKIDPLYKSKGYF